jgi:sigma-B regulation protein RsbU (phosphoserine phosphatase)
MQDGKHVILCVDDDADFLATMRFMLEKNGYVMVQAQDGAEGLKVFKEASPDAVIVDLMMEEVDAGVNFVKELKLLGANTPVFLLSSMGDSLSEETDYSYLKLSGILQKPVSQDNLISLLQRKL